VETTGCGESVFGGISDDNFDSVFVLLIGDSGRAFDKSWFIKIALYSYVV